MNTQLDLYHNVPYRYYIIEDYSEEESYMFLVENHAFADGLNYISALTLLSDSNYQIKNISQVKGVSLYNKLLGFLLLPFITAKVSLRFLMLPYAKNCIKKDAPVIRNRLIKVSENFNRDDFAQSCKLNQCTFTQANHSIIGQIFKEYSANRGEPNIDQIIFGSTFALAPMPQSLEEVKMGNQWVPYLLPLTTKLDFKECLKHNRNVSKQITGSMDLLG